MLAIASWLDPVAVAARRPRARPAAARPARARGGPPGVAARVARPPGRLRSGAGLSLARGGDGLSRCRRDRLPVDLATVNAGVNPLAPGLVLRPASRRRGPHRSARPRRGRYRFFSYGVAHSPALLLEPGHVARVLGRLALLPRPPGAAAAHARPSTASKGAFDVDRMGLAPAGSTLAVAEAEPGALSPALRPASRPANVRWVLSFDPLPEELASRRAEVRLARGPASRCVLYELAGRRCRAPSSYGCLDGPPRPRPADGGDGESRVAYEPESIAHTVAHQGDGPPRGSSWSWTATTRTGRPRTVGPGPRSSRVRAYRAIPTRGGEPSLTLRYRPRWRAPALLLARHGGAGRLVLALRR